MLDRASLKLVKQEEVITGALQYFQLCNFLGITISGQMFVWQCLYTYVEDMPFTEEMFLLCEYCLKHLGRIWHTWINNLKEGNSFAFNKICGTIITVHTVC